MDKLATLNYRPNRKKPYFVRFYDESGKRTSRAFAARVDAMQFMAEKSDDAKTSHFDISTEEKELVMRLKRKCLAAESPSTIWRKRSCISSAANPRTTTRSAKPVICI